MLNNSEWSEGKLDSVGTEGWKQKKAQYKNIYDTNFNKDEQGGPLIPCYLNPEKALREWSYSFSLSLWKPQLLPWQWPKLISCFF